MAAASSVLERVFGYKQFRSHQAAIIETLIEGHPVPGAHFDGGELRIELVE